MRAERILVPLDGSPLAEAALPAAVEFAQGSPGTTLVLLRAAEAARMPGVDPTEAQVTAVREAEEYLQAVSTRLVRQGVKPVKTSVWYGPPAPAIVEAARVTRADLIVMCSHGRSGLGRLILGSVAESVLRGTRTPILMLRPGEAPVEALPGAGEVRSTKEATHV
jgi:nucleotide-binding universal stress UspA family protein